MPGKGRRVGPRAWYEEKQEAARRKLYNEDAEGPGGLQCYITGRVMGKKALTPGGGEGMDRLATRPAQNQGILRSESEQWPKNGVREGTLG